MNRSPNVSRLNLKARLVDPTQAQLFAGAEIKWGQKNGDVWFDVVVSIDGVFGNSRLVRYITRMLICALCNKMSYLPCLSWYGEPDATPSYRGQNWVRYYNANRERM